MNQLIYGDCYETAKFVGTKSAYATWYATKFLLSNCYSIAKISINSIFANSHKIPKIYQQSKSNFKEGLAFCGHFVSLMRQKKKTPSINPIIGNDEPLEDLHHQQLIIKKSNLSIIKDDFNLFKFKMYLFVKK